MHIMDDDSNRSAAVEDAPRNNGSLKTRRKSVSTEVEKDSDSGKENGPTREPDDEIPVAKEAAREPPAQLAAEKAESEEKRKEDVVKEEMKDEILQTEPADSEVKPEALDREEENDKSSDVCSTNNNNNNNNNNEGEVEQEEEEEEEEERAVHENSEGNDAPDAGAPAGAAAEEEQKVDVEEHRMDESLSLPLSPAEEDDASRASSPANHQMDVKRSVGETRKRGSSESDQETPSLLKKMKLTNNELAERERMVSDYVESSSGTSLDEIQRCSEKLQQEISTLNTLARAKEQEWNNIIRVRKIKEEMLLRLQRKRDVMLIMMGSPGKGGDAGFWDLPFDLRSGDVGGAEDFSMRSKATELMVNNMTRAALCKGVAGACKGGGSVLNAHQPPGATAGVSILKSGQNQLPVMMVPVVSSSAGTNSLNLTTTAVSGGATMTRIPENCGKDKGGGRCHRPILPKPTILLPQVSAAGNNGQNPVIGEGRQGPILDVRSIIADYRSKHPGDVPRRGRRLKSALSPGGQVGDNLVTSTRVSGAGNVLSMASLALGSGSHVRPGVVGASPCEMPDLGFLLSGAADASRLDTSRPSSADSSRSGAPPAQADGAAGISFKDVLVQFAKLSQNEQRHEQPLALAAAAAKPPPYPEVTLHPVLAPHSPPHQSPSTSLLHGILTKSTPMQQPRSETNARATTFSPTLARLLTAPERVPGGNVPNTTVTPFHGSAGPVSISDLLSTSKTRNEITITPVAAQQPIKTKEEVVLLEEEQEDSADRLVIDESVDGDKGRDGDDEQGGSQDISPDEVPECQGCHQRPAQFVCAGCGNQWYCSRDCQVSAWDEHSEVCSG